MSEARWVVVFTGEPFAYIVAEKAKGRGYTAVAEYATSREAHAEVERRRKDVNVKRTRAWRKEAGR